MVQRKQSNFHYSINPVMKSLIKIITTVLLFLSISFTGVESQASVIEADSISAEITSKEKKALFNKMEVAFLYGLNSNVNGILESSFHHIIVFKATYNDFDSDKVTNALNKVAKEADTHFIRYRALLTLALMRDQDRFGSDLSPLANMNNKDEAFEFLNERLNADKFTAK